jgi:hypothetical protein
LKKSWLSPFCQGPCNWALNCFFFKKQTIYRLIVQIIVVVGKSRLKFFYSKIYFLTHFDLKHHGNRDRYIYDLRKSKKPPQKLKSTQIQNSTQA